MRTAEGFNARRDYFCLPPCCVTRIRSLAGTRLALERRLPWTATGLPDAPLLLAQPSFVCSPGLAGSTGNSRFSGGRPPPAPTRPPTNISGRNVASPAEPSSPQVLCASLPTWMHVPHPAPDHVPAPPKISSRSIVFFFSSERIPTPWIVSSFVPLS